MAVLIGLVLFAAALYGLFRLKQKDIAESAAVLELAVSKGAQSKGRMSEGWEFHEGVVAQGTLEGVPAVLSSRMIKGIVAPKANRSVTQFTVLSLQAKAPASLSLRLQPAGVTRLAEQLTQGAPVVVPTGDAAFDEAYKLYSDNPAAAIAAIGPDVRAAMLGLYAASGVGRPGTPANYLASASLLGTFEIAPDRSVYYVFGSPTKKVAEHIKAAAPILARLAGIRTAALR
ncbi:MAG: hypothetical protein IT307_17050 [Chloroflexi bacterium]|nr:hypothetical protein [Chloroflexota bacterium]